MQTDSVEYLNPCAEFIKVQQLLEDEREAWSKTSKGSITNTAVQTANKSKTDIQETRSETGRETSLCKQYWE